MDSLLWHAFCTRVVPAEPAPLTLREYQALSPAERRAHIDQLERWLGQLYVHTAELETLAQRLSRIVHRNSQTLPGAKDIALITGPNLVGKSTFTKMWAKGRYAEWTADASIDIRGMPVWYPDAGTEYDLCPVIWINLQSAAQRSTLDAQILEFFGLPDAPLARGMTSRVVRAVQRHRVWVVVVDDVQLMKTNLTKGREVLDHVKHLNTELGENGASLVLVGANLNDGDLVADPQVAGRLKKMVFPRYEIDTVDEARTWQRIVRDIEIRLLPHLPAGKEGMLFTDLAGELWHLTQGFIGELVALIRKATLDATTDGTHMILRHHLEAVSVSERAEVERRANESPRRPRSGQAIAGRR
jgi:hypothetical protein